MPCIFCEIVAGRQPAHIIYKDDSCLAFMDIMPITTGHVLVIPKQHAENIWELDDLSAKALMPAAQKVATALRQAGLPCDGLNLFMANGRVAGQSVFHAHVHVVPRTGSDGFGLLFPPGYGAIAPETELTALAKRIKQTAALSPGSLEP